MPKRKKKNPTFSRNQIAPGTALNAFAMGGMADSGQKSGGSQPPKNRIVHIAHISTTLTYSPRKKSRKNVAEYSTKKPATSSDSASTRSKGGRLVSASAETKKIGSMGK